MLSVESPLPETLHESLGQDFQADLPHSTSRFPDRVSGF